MSARVICFVNAFELITETGYVRYQPWIPVPHWFVPVFHWFVPVVPQSHMAPPGQRTIGNEVCPLRAGSDKGVCAMTIFTVSINFLWNR